MFARRVLQRVLHQVGDDLGEPVRVRVGRQRLRARRPCSVIPRSRRCGPERVDRGPDGLGGVDRARGERELAGVDPGEVEEVGDEAFEPAGLGGDDARRVRVLLVRADRAVGHGLRVAADRGERGAQVVGDAEDERALHALRVLELRGHRVQRASQVRELVLGMTAEVDAGGEVTRRDRPRRCRPSR